jgi:hypothetical protein
MKTPNITVGVDYQRLVVSGCFNRAAYAILHLATGGYQEEEQTMTKEEMDQAVVTYNDYLDRMMAALQHLQEDIRDSDYQQLSPVIASVIDGFDWLVEAVDSFVRLGKLDIVKYTSFQELLKNINQALENKDYILFCDLAEFEMILLLNELKVEDLDN